MQPTMTEGISTCEIIVRDVGVAGSNPVTPTIDFIKVFPTPLACGSKSESLAVPKTVPVSARENHARFRLSLDAHGKNIDRSHSSRRLGWDSRRNRFCGGCRWLAASRIFLQN